MTRAVNALLNARALGAAVDGRHAIAQVLPPERFFAAFTEITQWPGYAATPLVSLPAFAHSVGCGQVIYKDEGGRFGLGSFKALGGAYAVARVLARELVRLGVSDAVTAADLASGRYLEAVRGITVTSATDGNHGRSVAWGARLLGCRAVIFIHESVSEGRRAAIARYGAEVARVQGGYDDSVRHAFTEAARNGWHVVQDTGVGDYREVPADITCGYGVIAEEIVREIEVSGAPPPTHVLVQAGVGGVASALCARFLQLWGARRPVFLVLEPANAACVAASLAAGRRVDLTGSTETVMAGLACGEVSALAWEILSQGADGAVILEDAMALAGMRRLADPLPGDPAIVAGECSGAAAGALIALSGRPELRTLLGIDEASRVLLLGTEGATDPEIFEQIVGRKAEDVAQDASRPSGAGPAVTGENS